MQNMNVPSRFSQAPRDSRLFAQRDSRSFVDVMNGKAAMDVGVPPPPPPPPSPPPIKAECIQEIKDWFGKSAIVGEAKSFDILCNFPSLLELEGYDVLECRYIGGMQILIKFRSDRAAEVIKIGVSEYDDDWTPFKPFVPDLDSESEDDSDEEAVSDTWQQERNDLEDGEFISANGDFIPAGDGLAGKSASPTDPVEDEVAHEDAPFPKEAPRDVETHASDTHASDGKFNDSPMQCESDPSLIADPVRNNPPVGPRLSPIVDTVSSSPDFEPGESGLKRRRTKVKKKDNSQFGQGHLRNMMDLVLQDSPVHAQTVSSNSIDLNRQAPSPQRSSNKVNSCSSPSGSFLSSSSVEMDRTIEVGKLVGFQINRDNHALLHFVGSRSPGSCHLL
ncbi:hypothetical protein L2E82_01160 [Cichorium intybus]|uniref:Uncharacterized protein n=1 Tax=Cichorium intybus TaxID=13427 RepID=A0ACB9GZD3_CICIN|nr:hypothetical protein L2E82_01160 [Cichorium intybus]